MQTELTTEYPVVHVMHIEIEPEQSKQFGSKQEAVLVQVLLSLLGAKPASQELHKTVAFTELQSKQ